MIGDIGEEIAKNIFNLTPLNKGAKTHDMVMIDSKQVQIKTTQATRLGKGLSMGTKKQEYEYLIVLQIKEDLTYTFYIMSQENI